MQKGAYVHSLLHLALILDGTYKSYKSGDLDESWKKVNDAWASHIMVGVNMATHYNDQDKQ